MDAGALSKEQEHDLQSAIADILQVYANDNADGLVSYMEERGEKLKTEAITFMRNSLINEWHLPKRQINSLKEQELFRLFWSKSGVSSHWKGLVADSSCTRLWTWTSHGRAAPPDNTLGRGPTDFRLWGNWTYTNHLFTPGKDMDPWIAKEASVLMADVKVVIRHDDKLFHEASPYYFRFRYEPAAGRWHPTNMGHIGIGAGTVRLMF